MPSLFADIDPDALERRLIPLGEPVAEQRAGRPRSSTSATRMTSELVPGRGVRIIEARPARQTRKRPPPSALPSTAPDGRRRDRYVERDPGGRDQSPGRDVAGHRSRARPQRPGGLMATFARGRATGGELRQTPYGLRPLVVISMACSSRRRSSGSALFSIAAPRSSATWRSKLSGSYRRHRQLVGRSSSRCVPCATTPIGTSAMPDLRHRHRSSAAAFIAPGLPRRHRPRSGRRIRVANVRSRASSVPSLAAGRLLPARAMRGKVFAILGVVCAAWLDCSPWSSAGCFIDRFGWRTPYVVAAIPMVLLGVSPCFACASRSAATSSARRWAPPRRLLASRTSPVVR